MPPQFSRWPRNGADLRAWALDHRDRIVLWASGLGVALGVCTAVAGAAKGDAALASAGATIALVGIAGWYAERIRELVDAIRRHAEQTGAFVEITRSYRDETREYVTLTRELLQQGWESHAAYLDWQGRDEQAGGTVDASESRVRLTAANLGVGPALGLRVTVEPPATVGRFTDSPPGPLRSLSASQECKVDVSIPREWVEQGRFEFTTTYSNRVGPNPQVRYLRATRSDGGAWTIEAEEA